MDKEIAKIIRSKRENAGMTQRELADKINVTQSIVSRYESGKQFPPRPTLVKLADVFNCSLDELIGRRRAS